MRFKRTIVAMVAPLAISASACDPSEAPVFTGDSSPSDVTAQDLGADAPEPRVAAPACADLPARAPLTPGLWGSRQFRTTLVGLPPTGTLSEVRTKLMVLHEVSESDGDVRIRHITCSITQPRLNGVETVFGPAFIGAVPNNTVTATIEGRNVNIARDRIVLGANLVDPISDDLPTDPEDARVVDADNDTHPGMTVTLQGLFQAQLYITYRHAIGFIGTADAGGCVEGLLDGDVQQTQLGSSDEALMAYDFSPNPHPDPSINTFTMVPVADGLTCNELLSGEVAIFGPDPFVP